MTTASLAPTPLRFSAENPSHKSLFASALIAAAKSDAPVYIGRIALPGHRVACLRAEGRARTDANRLRLGCKYRERQTWGGNPFTLDEMGRLAEGAIEGLISVQAAPVVAGVDARPDVLLSNIRFDIKAAYNRPGHSFAVAKSVAGGYDAVIFVEITADKKMHVWCCKARPDAWEERPGVRGGDNFYLVHCPAPAMLQ